MKALNNVLTEFPGKMITVNNHKTHSKTSEAINYHRFLVNDMLNESEIVKENAKKISKIPMLLFISTYSKWEGLSALVGMWHFFVPYLFQWYSCILNEYKNLIAGIEIHMGLKIYE